MATPQRGVGGGATAAAAPGIRPPAPAGRGAVVKPAAGPATAGPAKTPGRTAAKPKKEAPPKKDAPPAGKRMKDGYWAGGVKMFKPNGNGRYVYDNGDIYEGMMKEGRRQTESKGSFRTAKFIASDGAVYRGQFSTHRFHGDGRMKLADGTNISGKFVQDRIQVDLHKFADGGTWSGYFFKFHMDGPGTLLFGNGDRYVGAMHLGKMHGEGEYFCRSGDYYKGTFNEGWNGSLGGRGEVEAGEGWTTFSNGDVWMGGFDAGVPHGPGTMRFADGDVSEVEADHGVFHGEHLFEVGDRYSGAWEGNLPHGEGEAVMRGREPIKAVFDKGVFEHFREDEAEGFKEKGFFRNFRLEGQGSRQHSGEDYDGEFHQGYYHGRGVQTWAATGLRYEGDFKSGRFHGNGRLEYGKHPPEVSGQPREYPITSLMHGGAGLLPEGAVYTGDFVDGARSGKGVFESSIETYRGEFDLDKYSGKGTWTSLVDITEWGDQSWYEGEWAAGKRDGQGEYRSEIGYHYTGGWLHGLRNGDAVESTVPPGLSGTYTGQFLRDKRHGEGRMEYDSGDMFDGDWRAGVRHGRGMQVFSSGGKYRGEWQGDAMHGRGIYTVPPITRDERLRLYRVHHIVEAERSLVEADGALDRGDPVTAKKHYSSAEKAYSVGGFLDKPRPTSAKALKNKLEVGYEGGGSVLGRATLPADRQDALKALIARIETAAAEIRAAEDLDLLVKAARDDEERMRGDTGDDKDEDGKDTGGIVAKAAEMAAKKLAAWQKMHIPDPGKDLRGNKRPLKKAFIEQIAEQQKKILAEITTKLKKERKAERLAKEQAKQDGITGAFEELIKEISNGTYDGELLAGLRSGHGTRVYGNGEKYEGGWRLGKRHGEGVLTFRDGSLFTGPFQDGVRHGRGVFTSKRGLKFVGEFVKGKREGYGEAEMSDGGWYKGDYFDDKPHGKGHRRFASGAAYHGDFLYGVQEGQGRFSYPDGSGYVGRWKTDVREGFGTWTSAKGDSFIGEWRHDKAISGKAVKVDRVQGTVYHGDIFDATPSGFGILTRALTGEFYEGWWKLGKRCGHGRSEGGAATGGADSWFDGEWRNDEALKGIGRVVNPDGSWYSGDLVRTLQHGAGVMSYTNGDIYDGEWKSGLRHGHGTMVKGTEVFEGTWIYGEAAQEGEGIGHWEEYKGSHHLVRQEMHRDALRAACAALHYAPGRSDILSELLPDKMIVALTTGTLRKAQDALARLKEEERAFLADDDDDVANLARIRAEGGAIFAKTHTLLDGRAWSLMPLASKKEHWLRADVASTIKTILDTLTVSASPSVVTWLLPRRPPPPPSGKKARAAAAAAAAAAEEARIERSQRVGKRKWNSRPSIVTWFLPAKPPPPPVLPSVVTWAASACPMRPSMAWRGLRRLPDYESPEDLLERLRAALSAEFPKLQFVSKEEVHLFKVLGCPPDVDPIDWSQAPFAARLAAYQGLAAWVETGRFRARPSVVSWATSISQRVGMPAWGGCVPVRGAAWTRVVDTASQVGKGAGQQDAARLVDFWLSEGGGP